MPDTRRPDLRNAFAESVLRAASRTGTPADGTRRNCPAQGADAHYQYLHFETFKIPAMKPSLRRLKP
jgi:hypothetical protein